VTCASVHSPIARSFMVANSVQIFDIFSKKKVSFSDSFTI
jgi:hypothetical protein